MRVAGIGEVGGAVTTLELPDPRAPRDGEVLIAVEAASINGLGKIVVTP